MKCAAVELLMAGYGQNLSFTSWCNAQEFHVATALGMNLKTPPTQDLDDLIAGEATKFRHEPAHTRASPEVMGAEPVRTR